MFAFTYFQCKPMCIEITIMNINAVHSWTVIKKCLIETKKLPRASNPLGSMSQLTRPVPHKIIRRVNEVILMTQSFENFFIDICNLTAIVMFPAFCSRFRVPTRTKTDLNQYAGYVHGYFLWLSGMLRHLSCGSISFACRRPPQGQCCQ